MATPTTARPKRIGRYTILGELASGATARVFLAQRDDEPEIRVVKQLKSSLEKDATARMRFQREALLAARLSHPNIAKTYWSSVEEGQFCLAMEYVAGQTMHAVLEKLRQAKASVPPGIALPIALGVLDALDYAHSLTDESGEPLRIVHRDLSANNVMLSYAGATKIIDFGTARGLVDDFRTMPGMRVGTLLYMSPEQAMSMPIDLRTDLYAAAVLLYEMLTGRPLVEGTESVDILEEIAYKSPPPVSEIVPGFSEELSEVVARGLAKAPEHRWQTARDFAAALRDETGETTTSVPEEIGRFLRDLFPQAEAAAARTIEEGRARHSQEHEETVPDDAVDFLDTVLPDDSGTLPSRPPPESGARRLPPPKPEPQKWPAMRVYAAIALAVLIGVGIGALITLLLTSASW